MIDNETQARPHADVATVATAFFFQRLVAAYNQMSALAFEVGLEFDFRREHQRYLHYFDNVEVNLAEISSALAFLPRSADLNDDMQRLSDSVDNGRRILADIREAFQELKPGTSPAKHELVFRGSLARLTESAGMLRESVEALASRLKQPTTEQHRAPTTPKMRPRPK